MKGVTFIMTSCNRVDLLERTFDSFIKYNTHPIEKYYIIEDSGLENINDFILGKYPDLPIEIIYNNPKLGQIKSIDFVYSKVNTEYIFHCEEDWEFYRDGFIEYSIEVLESGDNILQCWLREDNDTNGHPIDNEYYNTKNFKYRLMSLNYRNVWHGFTFNPTLIKYSDYKLIGPYSKYKEEHDISIKVNEMGFRCAKSDSGFVKHIGWGRHVY